MVGATGSGGIGRSATELRRSALPQGHHNLKEPACTPTAHPDTQDPLEAGSVTVILPMAREGATANIGNILVQEQRRRRGVVTVARCWRGGCEDVLNNMSIFLHQH